MADVTFVVGTLPEIVKSIDVACHLAAFGREVLIFDTRQNRSEPFEAPKSVSVLASTIRRGAFVDDLTWVQNCAAEIADVASGLIVVQGDTYSGLAGAHGASSKGRTLAHIEAGMRSFDALSPFPEEMNRIFIDSCSKLLFCATHQDYRDLASSLNLDDKHVFVVGNTVCDPIFRHRSRLQLFAEHPAGVIVSLHRRENWQHRDAILDALAALAGALPDTSFTILRRGLLAQVEAETLGPNVFATGLVDHLEFLETLSGSALAICDSGGILEECVTLNVPVICLRHTLERGRAVDGVTCLDPASMQAMQLLRKVKSGIAAGTRRRESLDRTFGDGRAAERIAVALNDYLDDRAPQGAIGPLRTDQGWGARSEYEHLDVDNRCER